MSLLLTEGFDWLPNGAISNNYGAWSDYNDGGTVPTRSISASGRTGKCLEIVTKTATASVNHLQGISLSPSGLANGVRAKIGFAIKFNANNTTDQTFFGIYNGAGTIGAKWNFVLARTGSGNLKAGFVTVSSTVITGANTYGPGATVLANGVWYYIEVDFQPHDTTGLFIVRINGVVESALNKSNIDTLNNNNSYVGIVLGGSRCDAVDVTLNYDDFYLLDTAGSINNDLLGDRAVQTIIPNGNGNSSQMVGSDADSVDNYLHVDEGTAGPDDDTSYVQSATSGNKDTYAYSNLSGAASVNGVVIKTVGKKVDAGAADGKAVARSSTTEADSAALGFSTNYTIKNFVRETDPNTSAAWAPSAVDAAEFGVKVA